MRGNSYLGVFFRGDRATLKNRVFVDILSKSRQSLVRKLACVCELIFVEFKGLFNEFNTSIGVARSCFLDDWKGKFLERFNRLLQRIADLNQAAGVHEVDRVVFRISIQVEVSACQSDWITLGKSAQRRVVRSCPHEVKTITVIGNTELSREGEGIGRRGGGAQMFAKG